jgi:pyruvate kinase
MVYKKTKIVATLGPASEEAGKVASLIKSGVDVFRLNFSHGDHAEHGKRFKTVRQVSEKLQIPTAILADLQGPKIRIGDFAAGTVKLTPGKKCVLTSEKCDSDENRMSVSYSKLPDEVKKGDIILLDDGRRRLLVSSVKGKDITCIVEVGGEIKGRRGLSVPTASLSISSMSDKDKMDLEFALKQGADIIALSFVRKAKDVEELRAIIKRSKSNAAIVSKIETREAIENIDEIIKVSDGIMVARGDLAVETSPEEVPLFQKTIIEKANRAGKPVITATQMLESMSEAPVPTRAEVSDVANAILDGTDAIMLSAETSLGKFPEEAVSVMSRVAEHVEKDYLHRKSALGRRGDTNGEITDSVTQSAVLAAESLNAKAIVALTMSGRTARMISRHKPEQEIFAFTPNQIAEKQLQLSFGVRPFHIKSPDHIDDVLVLIRKHLTSRGFGKRGDKVVVVCGLPFGKSIDTNMVLVETL